jgi:putative sigma-54 modulation protein
MKINIQTIDFNPRQDLLDLVDEKVGKLGRFSDRIIECKVLLRVEKSDKRDNKITELRAVIPGNDIFVKKQYESFEEGIQKATEALERQIKEWKEKNS